jgi:type 1 glutamine amidotransferase
MALPRIVFHVGGPAFHPVQEQAHAISRWLGPEYDCATAHGHDAFDRLDRCDLLIPMGLFWTGSSAEWAGGVTYRPLDGDRKAALERYAQQGRPILAHHGAIASYDDWPRFGEILGFTWVWGTTTHSPFGTWTVNVTDPRHPVMRGVADYTLEDELYYNVKLASERETRVHATAMYENGARPMVMTLDAGVGGGRRVYLANGHDMKAFVHPAMRTLWINAVNWCLGRSS